MSETKQEDSFSLRIQPANSFPDPMKRFVTAYFRLALVGAIFALAPKATAQNAPLQIACPPGRTNLVCGTASFAIVNYPAPAIVSACPSNVTVTCTPPSGSSFPLGTSTVFCQVTNSCGQSASCTFSITVAPDATPPDVTCPPPFIMFTANPAGRFVSFGSLVTSSDPTANISCLPASGSWFPLGITSVVCTARDACSNQSVCTFSVEVKLLQLVAVPAAGTMQLSWDGGATLEAADEVSGPWLPIRSALSPYIVPFAGAKKFFRLANAEGSDACGEVVLNPSHWHINVPSARIQGEFLLDGQPFPSSFLQGANFFLRHAATGDEVYLGLSNNQSYDRRVVPGHYDVIYEHKIGDEVPLNTEAILVAGLDISGDMVFDIDVPSVGVGGDFLLNGVPFPVSNLETGRIQARDRQNGALSILGETSDQTYVARLIPGAYDLMYSRIAGTAIVPANRLTAFRRDVAITNNGALDLDVPAITVNGQFLINGSTAPALALETGRISLLDADTGMKVLLGETRSQNYQVILIPNNYDLHYERVAGSVLVPANSSARFLTDVPVLTAGAQDIDLPMVAISGAFRVNGEPAPNLQLERAALRLRQGEDEVYLGQTTAGGFQLLVIPGTYQVHYTHITGSVIMPANTNAVLATVVIAGAAAFDINILTAMFSAAVTFNGGDFPGPGAGESARLYLEDPLTDDLILLGEYPALNQVSRLMIQGNYRVRYAYKSGVQLPRNTFAMLGSPLVLTQSVATGINIGAASLSGSFLLNGAAFPAPSQNAAITLQSLTQGDSLYLGGTSAGSYSTVIVPGYYRAFYNWAMGDLIPRNQNARLICPR